MMLNANRIRKALAALAAFSILLVGCSTRDAQAPADAPDIQPDAAAQTLLETVTFRDTLVKAEGGAAENYYKLDDTISEYAIYISGSGATAEEIAVLKVAGDADPAGARAIVEKRVESLKLQFESYVPAEMVKLGKPVIVERGDVVILVLADDTDAATQAVEDLFA